MDLEAALAEQIDRARRIAAAGSIVIPAWRIGTPEGEYLILTRYNEAEPEQRERALVLISRFMAWKLATAFVLTSEGTSSDGEGRERDFLFGAAVSRHGVTVARQSIARTATTAPFAYHTAVEFGHLERFDGPEAIDPLLLELLPTGAAEVAEHEARLLAAIFAEDGEMPAHRLH